MRRCWRSVPSLMPRASVAHLRTTTTSSSCRAIRRLTRISHSFHPPSSSSALVHLPPHPLISHPMSSPSSPSSSITFERRHLTLPPPPPLTRVLFIGDVHGCYDELQELLSLSGVRVGVDLVLLCGDLVAKGPKPFDVLRFVHSTPNVWSVMGNHDHHVVQAMLRRQEKPLQGVVPPYDEQPHDHVAAVLSHAERAWYAALPLSISLPWLQPPHLLVHAGLVPGTEVEAQEAFLLMNIRNVTDEGRGIKGKKEGVNWVERWNGPPKVVFGHAAARGLQLVEGGMALGLDSGCCYGKQLSGWLLPEGQLLQVQAKRVYQQPDGG